MNDDHASKAKMMARLEGCTCEPLVRIIARAEPNQFDVVLGHDPDCAIYPPSEEPVKGGTHHLVRRSV